jgi:hypothetical protein
MKGGTGAMIMKSGEHWHCTNVACGCSVFVETAGKKEGSNPRCPCGSVMKKDYLAPVFREMEIVDLRELDLISKDSGKV